MAECICPPNVLDLRCDRFKEHVTSQIVAEFAARLQAEDDAFWDRVLNGTPGAEPPRGVIRA